MKVSTLFQSPYVYRISHVFGVEIDDMFTYEEEINNPSGQK
jgi:hypothetical protein